jgi:hypothetical protein
LKRSLVKTAAVLGLATLLYTAAARGASEADLLPPDGTSGYARAGSPRVFKGAQLYDHIDGGGEPFLELGFETCAVQKYRKGKGELVLELYRMTDSAAALGVYLMNCGAEGRSPEIAERHALSPNQLLLLKGRHYAVATSPEERPGLEKDLVAFGKALAAAIPDAPAPPILDLLPREGLSPGTTRIIRGPVLLDSVVTLGPGDVLLLKGRATAVAADLKGKDGAVETLIVADYSEAAAALAALAHLQANLDPGFELLASSASALVVRAPNGTYGQAKTDGKRLEIRLGLGQRPAP